MNYDILFEAIMERINGFKIPFELSNLKLRANLIEQDGPLLSLYYNDRGDYYLLYWVDCDNNTNRWIAFRTDNESLLQYLNQEIPLYDLIERPSDNFVWITDIDNDGKQVDAEAIPSSSIPKGYLPDKDSFFVFDHRQDLVKSVSTDKFEVDIPKSDKTLFSTLMSKMGWKLSPASMRRLIDRAAL